MGFALFALTSLYQPLRRVAVWMRPRRAHHYAQHGRACNAALRPCGEPLREAASTTPAAGPQAIRGANVPQPAPVAAPSRPLRVILNHHEGKACRLVIAGRMADVCAELERLPLH